MRQRSGEERDRVALRLGHKARRAIELNVECTAVERIQARAQALSVHSVRAGRGQYRIAVLADSPAPGHEDLALVLAFEIDAEADVVRLNDHEGKLQDFEKLLTRACALVRALLRGTREPDRRSGEIAVRPTAEHQASQP